MLCIPLLLIPVIGWLLAILIISVWYVTQQDKIHYILQQDNNSKYDPKKDKTFKQKDISKDELESMK